MGMDANIRLTIDSARHFLTSRYQQQQQAAQFAASHQQFLLELANTTKHEIRSELGETQERMFTALREGMNTSQFIADRMQQSAAASQEAQLAVLREGMNTSQKIVERMQQSMALSQEAQLALFQNASQRSMNAIGKVMILLLFTIFSY